MCMYHYRGISGDHKSASLKTNFCHDKMGNCFVSVFVVVSHEDIVSPSCLSFTTRFTDLIALMNYVIYFQFSCTLWLLGGNIHCCLLPVEKHSLLMVKKMFMADFSKSLVLFNLFIQLSYWSVN